MVLRPNRRCALLAPLGLALACAASSPPRPAAVPIGTPPSEESTTPVPAAPSAERPASLVGRYHLEAVDAVNLELYDGGEFRLSVYGCDYGSLECGRWERDGERLRLLPRAGHDRVYWFAQSSFRAEVPEIVLTATPGGVSASGTSNHAGPFQQEWPNGGTCADCAGEGPSGRHACAEPIPSCERQ